MITRCLRCGRESTTSICDTCSNRSHTCENCKKPNVAVRVHEEKLLCKSCYRNRWVPASGICPGCNERPRAWNKSFGLCRSCALDLKAELLPGDDICPSCGKTIKYTNEWRLQHNPRMLVCTPCYLQRKPTRVVRSRTQAEYRRERRERLLPKDRRCPVCKTVKLKLRSWVITDTSISCRSCSLKGKTAKLVRPPKHKPKKFNINDLLADTPRLNEDGSPVIIKDKFEKCMSCGAVYEKAIGCTCGIT